MSRPNIPLDLGWTIAEKFCAKPARGFHLLRPDSWEREVIVLAVHEAYRIAGSPISRDEVREYVSVTLPGLPGPALDLLLLIPGVGAIIHGLCSGLGAITISPSPAACADGNELLDMLGHEGDHGDRIVKHGVLSTLGYTVPEGRAGSEGPAYGQSVAGHVWLLGEDPGVAAIEAQTSLAHYALDAAAEQLADDLVQVARRTLEGDQGRPGVVPGTAREIVLMLQAAGVVGLPDVS